MSTPPRGSAFPQVERQASRVWLIAVWFGLVTGLAEVGVQAALKFQWNRYVHLGLDVVWMAPVAYVLLFALPAVLVFLVCYRDSRVAPFSTIIFVFTWLGSYSLLLNFEWLHWFARLLLACGMGAQTARWVGACPGAFLRAVGRSTPWLLALTAGLGVGVRGWLHWSERHALGALPPARAGAPNVLLLILDTVRAASLSLCGYPRPTTTGLVRLAKRGVVFDQAIATAPWTLPSHASMFTGGYPHELSAGFLTVLDARAPTLAEVLNAHGYATGGFVANSYYASRESGLGRGFAHYEDFVVTLGEIFMHASLGRELISSTKLRPLAAYYGVYRHKTAARVNRDFLRWLSLQHGRPFFAFLNYMDAHQPYLPPEPFASRFGPRTSRKAALIRNWKAAREQRLDTQGLSAEERDRELDAYEGAIAYLDHEIGALLDTLEARGALNHTLIIVASDHGEQFGEHGLYDHGNSLYLPVLHVPLLLVFPSRVPAGIRVAEPVTLRDLPATVVDLLGVEAQVRFPGASLARYWTGRAGSTQPLISEFSLMERRLPEDSRLPRGEMRSLVVGRYHYIRKLNRLDELYDVALDPRELRNLRLSAEGRRLVATFRATLDTLLEAARALQTPADHASRAGW